MSDKIKMSDDKVEFLSELASSRVALCKRAATSLSCAWSEIERLTKKMNLMCSQHDKEIQAIDDVNDSKLNLQHGIINELSSRIDRYQKLACQTCDGHGMVGNILDSMDCPDCLTRENRIKADAINEAISHIKSNTGVADDPSRELIAHLETCDDFANYAINLRKGESC